MTDPLSPPAWEARAEALLAQVPTPAPLTEVAVRRIYSQLTVAAPPAPAFNLRGMAFTAAAFVVVLNIAWAAYRHLAVQPPSPAAPPAAMIQPPPPPPAAVPPTAVSPTQVATPTPPASAPATALHRTPPRRPTSATDAPSPEAAPPSTLAAESEALGRAVKALRQTRDPTASLSLLDAYVRVFPHGVLSSEAWLLRVEVLAALDRGSEALQLIDRLEQSDGNAPRAQLDRLRRSIESGGALKGGEDNVDK